MVLDFCVALFAVWSSPHHAVADTGAGRMESATAPPCPPGAVVLGPPRIARRVEVLLRAHGAVTDAAACSAQMVRASLTPLPGRRAYVLDIVDAFGRRNRRQVADVRTAASLIESFAFAEDSVLLTPSSLLPPPISPPPAPVVAAIAPPFPPVGAYPVGPTSIVATTQAAPIFSPTWKLMAAADLAAGSDGSLWSGAHVGACFQLRSWCLGGRARLARDLAISGPVSESGDPVRGLAEFLLVAARPFRGRRWSFNPALGIGGDWMRLSVPAAETDPRASVDTLGVRAEAIFGAALAVSRHWALSAEVSASAGRPITTSTTNAAVATSIAGDNRGAEQPPGAQFRTAIGFEYEP